MKSNKKWVDIYRRLLNEAGSINNLVKIKIGYKKPLIKTIQKYTKKQDVILEAGCGSGITSSYLSTLGYKVLGIDINQEMLNFARKLAKEIGGNAKFLRGDIFDLHYMRKLANRFNIKIIFSHGVLEHFSDRKIIMALKIQLRVSNLVVFSIPSDGMEKSQIHLGDERLLSRKKWREIIQQTNGEIVKEFHLGGINQKTNKPLFIGFVISNKSI